MYGNYFYIHLLLFAVKSYTCIFLFDYLCFLVHQNMKRHLKLTGHVTEHITFCDV